jgi:hypothetical protein
VAAEDTTLARWLSVPAADVIGRAKETGLKCGGSEATGVGMACCCGHGVGMG